MMLWRETAGNDKREKPSRRTPDDTIELIHTALTTSSASQINQHNKRVTVSKTHHGWRVEAYGKDLWLVVDTNYVDVLLSIHEVRLEKFDKGGWVVTVVRQQQRKPSNTDAQTAEEMTRRILYTAFKRAFIGQKVVVQTEYESDPMPMQTTPTVNEEYEAAVYMDNIRAVAAGEVNLKANTERCSVCWWSACPARQEAPPAEGPRSGKPTTTIL